MGKSTGDQADSPVPLAVMLARNGAGFDDVDWAPGETVWEPKWDGYRALAQVGEDGAVRIVSRNGADLTGGFADVASAVAAQVPAGTVLDGELVVWVEGRIRFSALTARLGGRRRVGAPPATFLVFDVLVFGGADVRRWELRQRRELLEELARGWRPPLQLTPQTGQRSVAEQWWGQYSAVDVGVEGLVAKGVRQRYVPGRRGWVKLRVRQTRDVVVAAVVGSLEAPRSLVVALPDKEGRLRVAGATLPLRPGQVAEVVQVLEAPGPGEGASGLPEVVPARLLGQLTSRDTVRLVPVVPVVGEVEVDLAFEHGRWRHPCRFVRLRPDMDPRHVVAED